MMLDGAEEGQLRGPIDVLAPYSNSSGMGGWSAPTGLEESTTTTKRSAETPTSFSRVWAAPPPFTSQPSGATWSAPSMQRSSRSISPNGSTWGPIDRADDSMRGEDATHRSDSLRRVRAGRRYATVDPVPNPTVIPSSTSSAAARQRGASHPRGSSSSFPVPQLNAHLLGKRGSSGRPIWQRSTAPLGNAEPRSGPEPAIDGRCR
jgi:hypothetical protein